MESSGSSDGMLARLPLIFIVSFDELDELSDITLFRSTDGDLSSTLSSFVNCAKEDWSKSDEPCVSLSSAERT